MVSTYSIKNQDNKAAFAQGLKDGVPIALAYFAVSFSLGIAAKNAGLNRPAFTHLSTILHFRKSYLMMVPSVQ